MPDTDRGLGRSTQLRQALTWLAAAHGDAYAGLLRGLDEDPCPYWSALAAEPLSRSSTGDWVTARHEVTRAVLAEPALSGQPLIGGIPEFGDLPETDVAPFAAQAWEQVLQPTSDRLDLVTVATAAAVAAVGEWCGLDAAGIGRLRAAASAVRGAADAAFYPQNLADAKKIAGGMAELRCTSGTSADRFGTAAVGVEVAAGLLVNAVSALFEQAEAAARRGWERLARDSGHAGTVLTETLRYRPPIQLHATAATGDAEIAGTRIAAGERVVVVLGAANRDGAVFTEPGRFDPNRPRAELDDVLAPGVPQSAALSTARSFAEQGLIALARWAPRLEATGSGVRRTAAPVTRSLVTFPVSASRPRRGRT